MLDALDIIIYQHQSERHEQKLQKGRSLADDGRPDLQVMPRDIEKDTAKHNNNVPAHNDDREPDRQLVEEHEGDECRDNEQFIGNGIKKSAEFGLTFRKTRDHAVERVRNAREHKDREGLPVVAVDHEIDKKRDQYHSKKGDIVRKVHGCSLSLL